MATRELIATEVRMPRLTDSMEEGTIVRWLKSVGDEVAMGDELVEIETDKANTVFEADAAGVLGEIIAGEGETVPVGGLIARFGDPESADTQPSGSGAKLKVSPVARRIAEARGLDLALISGSGPGGRIVKADVEATPAADGPAASPVAATGERETGKGDVAVVSLSGLQQTVARRMTESKATAPHFHLHAQIDMTRCVEARERMTATAGEGAIVPSFNDMVVKACAAALRELPRANGAYIDGHLELYSRVNVGVAVAAEDALVVATVFDADRKGLATIARESRAIAERVRNGEITPPEVTDATFTVTNLGMYGVTSIDPVINPPQAAILGCGQIVPTPVVRTGEHLTAHVMAATLACDHRILYGADGAKLLTRIKTLLEEPLWLAM